jgi:Mg2+-importing ATPase
MIVFGLLSSAFDLATFFLLRGILHAERGTFQTTWFIVSVLTELAALLVLRTRRPAWRSRPGRLIVLLSAIVAVVALAAPFVSSLAAPLELTHLSAALIAAAISIVLSYALATELAKSRFYRGDAPAQMALMRPPQ